MKRIQIERMPLLQHLYESALPAIEAEIEAKLREEVERLTDLVRYARHFLHDAKAISDEEYAAIVMDNENGQRVARLDGI